MSVDATNLAQTVTAMRPMVPAKDFEISKRFYVELGFHPRPLTDRLVEMQLGVFSFILQEYYVREWADNFVVHLTVSDLGQWWDHIVSLCDSLWGALNEIKRSPSDRDGRTRQSRIENGTFGPTAQSHIAVETRARLNERIESCRK
jgi:hypothetical protein